MKKTGKEDDLKGRHDHIHEISGMKVGASSAKIRFKCIISGLLLRGCSMFRENKRKKRIYLRSK